MASPNAIFTDLVTMTFRNHAKEIRDNISKNNALIRRLTMRGKTRLEDGGLSIVAPRPARHLNVRGWMPSLSLFTNGSDRRSNSRHHPRRKVSRPTPPFQCFLGAGRSSATERPTLSQASMIV